MKQNITAAEFHSLDLRAGTIVEVRDFPEARKPAYQLWIDFGPLGILKSSAQLTVGYDTRSLQGRQVIAAVNLGERQVGPFRSQCLVLGVPGANGDVVLLATERPVPNGSPVA